MRQIVLPVSLAEVFQLLDPMARGEQVAIVLTHADYRFKFVVSVPSSEAVKILSKIEGDGL